MSGMKDNKRPDAVRLRALELLGKSQGDFVDNQDIRTDVVFHLTWDEDEPQALTPRRSKSNSREEG